MDASYLALAQMAKALTARRSGRAGIDAELERRFRQVQSQVQSLISAGDRDAARDILKEIDGRSGGLPQTLELQGELDKPATKP